MTISLILTTLLLTIGFIFALRPLAIKIGFFDHPDERKQHTNPTPPIGGLAIFLGCLLPLSLFDIHLPQNYAFIGAISLLVLVGLIDDHRTLTVKTRLSAQIIAALIMTELADVRITELGDLVGTGTIHLGKYSTLMTIFAVVGGINAFNMIDGIDGLSSSSALLSIGIMTILAAFFGNDSILNLGLIFIGALSAFLCFNLRAFGRKKAAIFLGDSGSTLVGFVVCWLIIKGSQGQNTLISPTLVLWVIALPLFDSICIMMRRLHKGKSPFAPDREHLHHLLPMKGFSVNETLIIILTLSTILSFTAIIASLFFNISDKILFATFLLCFCLFYGFMHKTINADN